MWEDCGEIFEDFYQGIILDGLLDDFKIPPAPVITRRMAEVSLWKLKNVSSNKFKRISLVLYQNDLFLNFMFYNTFCRDHIVTILQSKKGAIFYTFVNHV